MRSHNPLATMVNKSPINKLPVRLYNVQLIRFGSPVRRWTSLFFVFLATHRCVLALRQVFLYSEFTNPKLTNCVGRSTHLQVKKNRLLGSSHPASRSTVPKLVLFLFFIAFWFGAPAAAVTVMRQEEGSVRPDWRAAVQRKPRAKRKNL